MKKAALFLLLTQIASYGFLQAQTSSANAAFAAEEGVYLKVFLNNQLQNQDPKNYLRVEKMAPGNYSLRIETLGTEGVLKYTGNISLQQGYEHSYFVVIKNAKVLFYQANFSPIYGANGEINIDLPPGEGLTPASVCASVIKKTMIGEQDFADFEKSLENSFTTGRLSDIKSFVSGCNLKAAQAARLLSLLSMTDQTEFALYAYDYVCDPQNYYLVINKITFNIDKERVRKAIENKK